MAMKQDLGATWRCDCGKWNNAKNAECWKCHMPKVEPPKKAKRGRKKAETRA